MILLTELVTSKLVVNSLYLWRHLHYMLSLNIHHTVWWKTLLGWRFPFPRNFWEWAVILQKSVTWNSDSPLGIKDQHHGICQSGSFPSTGIACACHCLPQSPHVRLVCTLLTSPSHRSKGLFVLPFKYCLQIGLFAVYLNITIPKSIVTMTLCCCSLPCTFHRIFSHSTTPERPLQEMEAVEWSPAEVTAAVAEHVPCRIMWVVLSGICTFP